MAGETPNTQGPPHTQGQVVDHPNTQGQVVDFCPLRVMAPHASRTRRPDTGVNSHRLHKVAHRVLEDSATDGAADPTGWEHTYGS